MIINKSKSHQEEIILINASKLFEKGKPKNFLTDESIETIASLYYEWKEKDDISRVITKEEVVKNDYNLSPSRYVLQNGEDDTLPLKDTVVLLRKAEKESEIADAKLNEVLKKLGL